MSTSCIGCKFLYFQDIGYTNYTVLDVKVRCALDRNPNLPDDLPDDWNESPNDDNWPATKDGRCDSYAPGETIRFDCESDVRDELEQDLKEGRGDIEQLRAILGHSAT